MIRELLRILDAMLYGAAGRLGMWMFIDEAKRQQREAESL
jgi:hypothetical protein